MVKSKLTINEGGLDLIVEATDKVAETLSGMIKDKWEINIENFGNVDTKEYISSLKAERISIGVWRIYSDVAYAPYVEYGSGPAIGGASYVPPFAPILKWVESKLGYSGDEAKAVAYFIINKIKTQGIEPSPSARNALYETSYLALGVGRGILLKVK